MRILQLMLCITYAHVLTMGMLGATNAQHSLQQRDMFSCAGLCAKNSLQHWCDSRLVFAEMRCVA